MKWPWATLGGLIAASMTYLSCREAVPPCLRRSPPLGRTLGVHRTSWRIPFPRHASMSLVLGFRGAWVSYTPPRVPQQRRPYDAALPTSSGYRLAGSPACHGLPQCPGWGHWISHCCVAIVFGSGLCLGPCFSCAPPLLAGVLGSVCICVRAPLVPHQSWLGYAVWVCVLRLGFQLRPATPGWAVAGCVCLCACSQFTPPILAGVCGVGVCACARVSAAPRHSLLGCWGACVFVCALDLYPANPGWGARCGCVFLGSGFGYAPSLLAGVSGCVCVRVRPPLVTRHSWPGCAVRVCVLGLRFRLRPATPGWDFGMCVCLCARSACTPRILAGVCGVGVCAWARVSAAHRYSRLGCWRVCLFVCALRFYPTTSGRHVRCGCVCLGSGFGCAPPLLVGLLRSVCVCVRAPPGCAVWVCVLALGFRLRPATPRWGVGVCVCLCARSACTPRILAGMCGVGVCAWARVLAAHRHSWPGCWRVCFFVCALRFYPTTSGRHVRCGCVCLGSGFGCALPFLAGVLRSVCVCVRAPPGCAVWVCVLALGFWLRPVSAGWGVGVCFFLCALFACTLPLLAGVCGVGVCAWARVSAAPRHSWLSCWSVCLFVCLLRFYPTTPRLGVLCGRVCLGSGFGCAPALMAWVLACVFVCVRVALLPYHSWPGLAVWVCVLGLGFRLRPATPGWGVRRVCVCLGSRLGCALPLLAWVLACVFVCVRALFLPYHSWPGFAVWVCVLGLGPRLRPATPGWGVEVCVCLCARSSWVCGVGVCACTRVSAAPRHSSLGCWRVCVCLCALFACTLPLLARVCGVGVCAWARAWLRPATPRWAVGLCVCLCARSALTLPLLAAVCGVGVCAWARVSAAHRHSWLGCWRVCLFVCELCFYPTTRGQGLRCGCVCLGSRFGCAPPLLAGVLRSVCVCVRAPPGCAVLVCVLALWSRLRPAFPGLGVGVCVCLSALTACTLPLLTGVCGVGVCAWARVSAAPRHS